MVFCLDQFCLFCICFAFEKRDGGEKMLRILECCREIREGDAFN